MKIAERVAASGLPSLDAQVLAAHALGIARTRLVTSGQRELSAAAAAQLEALFARRRAGEPVAYITGEREFYGLSFHVTPAVLIPRPETELLVDFALEKFGVSAHGRVLDLGTGSGCVAVAVAHARLGLEVTAVDASEQALAIACDNARRLAAPLVRFLHGDWFGPVAGRRFDAVLANPPYIPEGDPHLAQGDLRFEPRPALTAGRDGLAAIREIVSAAPCHLVPGGWLAFEHGYDQAERCRALLAQAGFAAVFSRADLAGIERVSGGRLSLDAERSDR